MAGPPATPAGTGFPAEAFEFFEGLAADNSKAYWQAHRDLYEEAVAAPLARLADALDGEFGPVKCFRPYRDVRFSADKRPYQEHASLAGTGARGTGVLYFQLGLDGVLLAGGAYRPPTAVLTSFRESVDDPAVAASYDAIAADLASHGITALAEPLRTRPRGWPADHPRLDLLRMTNLAVATTLTPGPWLAGEECVSTVAATWRRIDTFNQWLRDHVPATM